MKAIIIAAGMGNRLRPLTEAKPKCLLPLNGQTILEHQIQTLREIGITQIVVIKGYKQELIDYPNITYYVNTEFAHNNILHSLFYAEHEMDDEFIAVYSDIVFEKNIALQLLNNKEDISILVDVDWQVYYDGRHDHPVDEAENVVFDNTKRLLFIGKKLPDKKMATGEFTGMMMCSKKGAHMFRHYFNSIKRLYTGKPFQNAPVFEKAYLTDIFQDMVENHILIHCVTVNRGWYEIDTLQDYERVVKIFSMQTG